MRFLLVAAAFSVAVARVSWKNSELLDQFDLQGNLEIEFAVCSRGCYIFASLPINLSGCEDKIIIGDHTLSQVASLVNVLTGEKGHLELSAAQKNTVIVNKNPNRRSCPLAIYAVSKSDDVAPSLIDPRLNEHGSSSDSLTFFSYEPYTIDHLEINEDTVASLYHTGSDAITPNDLNYCHAIHYEPKSDTKSILFPIRSPLLTIVMSNDEPFNYSTKMGIVDRVVVDGEMETIVASPGYIGCKNGDLFRFSIPQPSLHAQFVAEFTIKASLLANLLVSHDNTVLLESADDHSNKLTWGDTIWGDTRNGAFLSKEFYAGRQFNITWMGAYEWSAFATSLKISPASVVEKAPLSSAIRHSAANGVANWLAFTSTIAVLLAAFMITA